MTWHETLDQTVVALVVVQGLTLVGLACVIFERRKALAPARGA